MKELYQETPTFFCDNTNYLYPFKYTKRLKISTFVSLEDFIKLSNKDLKLFAIIFRCR